MGVIYKLKPEIREFILEQKKSNPLLSCRALTNLLENKFQIKVSKSSINSVIKETGLSLPVGRRRKKIRRRITLVTPPSIAITPALPTEVKAEEPITPVPTAPAEAKPEEPITPALPAELKAEEPVTPVPEAPAEGKPEEPIAPAPEAPAEAKPEEPIAPAPEAPAEAKPEEPAKPTEEIPMITPTETRVEIPIELPSERECTGAILLKAADYLMGGSYYITEAIRNRLNKQEGEFLAKTESLIYRSLFETPKEAENQELSNLWSLIGKKFSSETISLYLNELQSIKIISLDILQIISRALQEVHCVKVDYLDGDTSYLDGQMYTIWSTPNIPYDFSSTTYSIKSYINKYFYKDRPFVLFMAPGYATPTKEFFNFILSLDSREKKIANLTLYDNKLEKLEVISLEQHKRRFFIFGLWPWQFGQYRKVNKIEEFKPFYFETLRKDFYLAETEIELSQPVTKQSVTLRGCALKTNLAEKMRLIILSNFAPGAVNLKELASIYLSHWPNLEEGFQDFSRKIELFTYTPTSQRFFTTDNLLNKEPNPDINGLFYYYLMALDFYVMWHFLPFGYEDKDFSTIKECFYSLKARLKKEKDYILLTFQPPPEYPFLKDLEYACRRVNEREIILGDGLRLWLSL